MMKIRSRAHGPAFLDGFNWPADGIEVPDDFLTDAVRQRYIAAPQIVIETKDGDEWRPISTGAVDGGAGSSPPSVPAPASAVPDYAGALKRGIEVPIPAPRPAAAVEVPNTPPAAPSDEPQDSKKRGRRSWK